VAESRRFWLYVEGPRDSAILRSWARRLSRPLERIVEGSTVILGGRQPARAVEHFRRAAAEATPSAVRGLCILDRDGDDGEVEGPDEPGLEFFTWPRRHIESYLLVPAAIRRSLNGSADGPRVERMLEEYLPDEDARAAWASTDAKRLLAPNGPLARDLGLPLSAAGVARAMRADEIHGEVIGLFDRVRSGAGLAPAEPVIVRRRGFHSG